MAKAYKIVAVDKQARPLVVSEINIHKIESILWKNNILTYQVELPARCRRSLISNAPRNDSRQRFILFDRNVASDASALFDENPTDPTAREVALAVILFMRLCSFTPAALSALQEFESQSPTTLAYDDAVTFCRSLSAPIESYLNILNGKAKCLSGKDTPKDLVFDPIESNPSPFVFPDTWLCSYAATLKLASLERDVSIDKCTRMEMFLQWLHLNFFFSPPLWFVASQFLGLRRDQSIIKRIGTPDVTRLRKQAQNAAWDLNLLVEWHLKLKREEFCILATRDAALRNVAVRMREAILLRPDKVRQVLSEDWPVSKEVDRLIAAMTGYTGDLDNPERSVNQGLSREYYQEMIVSLESQLGIPPS